MNNDQLFWYPIWRLLAITFFASVALIAGCVANDKRVLADMVKNGANPMAARCAIGVAKSAELILCANVVNGN